MEAVKSLAFIVPVALLVLSCSPVGDPIARGSAHYRTQSCGTTAHGGIGSNKDPSKPPVPDLPMSAPSLSDWTGQFVSDGELSPDTETPYEISCLVRGTDILTVQARMKGPNVSPSAADPGSTTFVDINASIDGPSGIGSGTVGFYTTDTLGATPVTNTSCEIVATPMPLHVCSDKGCTGESREPGQTGRMWLRFSCPRVRVESTGMDDAGCESNGTIVMERCAVE